MVMKKAHNNDKNCIKLHFKIHKSILKMNSQTLIVEKRIIQRQTRKLNISLTLKLLEFMILS